MHSKIAIARTWGDAAVSKAVAARLHGDFHSFDTLYLASSLRAFFLSPFTPSTVRYATTAS